MQLMKLGSSKVLFLCVNKPLVKANATHGDHITRTKSHTVNKLAACVIFPVVLPHIYFKVHALSFLKYPAQEQKYSNWN